MSLSKFQLEILENAYQLMGAYILYIQKENPQLHRAADGNPSVEAAVQQATIIISNQIEML